ncbi:MAG TPA: heavy metal translocating P-type ATPase [Burkholderiales bacterium]|jgi:Cu2+-exporting ATPase
MQTVSESCYHCGLPVPAGAPLFALIDGERRPMCCAGCQAVAQTIAGNDLGGYYRSRTAYAARQAAEAHDELALYDLAQVQRDFVRESGTARETTLLLEGITCAACVWLNERHLARLPGVLSAQINYTTHRATVRWDPERVKLSQILEAVRAIGYRAFPSSNAAAEQMRSREHRRALWRLFVAGFGMMQVMMYALPTYLAGEGGMSADIEQLMRLASLILTVPVIAYSCAPFFRGAWRDLRARRLGMDVPVALGIAVAFGASVYATLAGRGEVYFDSVTMFVFFLLCGRYLELRARQKAAASLEHLDRAIPLAAHRLTRFPASYEVEEVPALSLTRGDLVLVKPGEAVPADGVLVSGETETDESLLTGESRPVPRCAGSELAAGAVNRLSPAVMRVERVGEATRASHIRRLTERAAAQRPPLVELTDRIAGWFVAGVLLAAAGAGLGWAAVDSARALWIAVAVLVVTCPCALSLATPTALAVAVGALARRGVVATRGHAIEALSRVTHVVLDKTGTLTQGRLALTGVDLLGGIERGQVLALAAALDRGSEHPIAQAVLTAAAIAATEAHAAPDRALRVEALRSVAGAGVEALIDGKRWRIGKRGFVAALAGPPAQGDAHPGTTPADTTPVWLGSEDGWAARLDFSDALRAEAGAVVAALHRQGKRVLILSGDDPATVAAVAARLGIAEHAGGLEPEDKHARVRTLQAQGAVVAMVGDGVNDAPVLAQAQLSIAMGSGAVLSQAQADVVLVSGRLDGVLEALRAGRRSMRIVRQNLVWAVAYNVAALPLAIAGYVTPWLAGIGMAGSSLLVVLNALRLIEPPERVEYHADGYPVSSDPAEPRAGVPGRRGVLVVAAQRPVR